MIKPFLEMCKIDLNQHIQLKPTFYKDASGKLQKNPKEKWLEYIEWAKVLELLYVHGADSVEFHGEIHDKKKNTIRICLIIDGKTITTDYPIIDGNSIIAEPNQMQIHKAELRGFVKAAAIGTGLGLSLWQKEEQLTDTLADTTTIKVNAKKLLLGAETMDELLRVWASISETEQVRFKDIFSQQKELLNG
jgi:hypothetical protein